MTAPAIITTQSSEIPIVGAAYSLQDWHFATLSRISGHLAKYNCIIACTPELLYPATYLATIAKFMAAALASYNSAPKTSSMSRWLRGAAMPIAYTPQIEVTPRQAVDYIRKALRICYSDESGKLLLEFENLERELVSSEFAAVFRPSN